MFSKIKQIFSFLIYDYETFGKHPALDRPVQFASVRVNKQFKLIEKPQVFICRPPDDYLPDPEAVLITNITPQKALSNGMVEAEFACKIYKLFNIPNTCILGYNNINFDDEITRNIFYRNFYDPYSWSWQQGNSRWDLFKIVKASYALRPEGIKWPLDINGVPSFCLENLANVNGIKFSSSHDALSDVYTTLALVKLLYKTQFNLFKFLYYYRQKERIKDLINFFTMAPLVYVSGIFHIDRKNVTCIAPLAWHPKNPNALIACDLSSDIQVIKKLADNDFLINSIDINKPGLINNNSDIPLKIIYVNKCPILFPISFLRIKDFVRLRIDQQRYLNNLKWLRNCVGGIRERILTFFLKPVITDFSLNVDMQLYKGFFNKIDRVMMNNILNTLPNNLSTLHIKFIDDRLKSLFFRYRARNFPYTLNDMEKLYWLEHRKKYFTQKRIKEYIEQLEKLKLSYKDNKQKKQLICFLFKYLYNLCNNLPEITNILK